MMWSRARHASHGVDGSTARVQLPPSCRGPSACGVAAVRSLFFILKEKSRASALYAVDNCVTQRDGILTQGANYV